MTAQNIEIDPKALSAIRLFAAEHDVRFYLNAVYVEATPSHTRLVATDGHALAIHETALAHPNTLDTKTFNVLIPTFVLDGLKPDAKLPVYLRLRDGHFELKQGDKLVGFTPIDRKFPDYPRIIPVKVSGEPAQFTGSLLTRFDKAQKLLNKKDSPIYHTNGDDVTLVTLPGVPQFLGLLMPFIRRTPDSKQIVRPQAPDTTAFRAPLPVTSIAADAAPERSDAFLD